METPEDQQNSNPTENIQPESEFKQAVALTPENASSRVQEPIPPAAPIPQQNPAQPQQELSPNNVKSLRALKQTSSGLGVVLGTLSVVFGLIGVGAFIFIMVALIQCARDPKCM